MRHADILVFLQEHHRSAYGWALHCCAGDRWDAEGVLHDAYLRVLQGGKEFRGESHPKTWLFALIRITAAQRRRRIVRRIRLLQTKLWQGSRVAHVQPAEGALERAQLRERLEAMLNRLPTRQREVLHLVFYQDLSLREVAEVMGVSIGTVRVHYHRGKDALRREIEESGLGHGRSWKQSNPKTV